ncbi:MAG: hypothetical protein P4L35_20285 [Ignavibacteriaceae bacterium]|nr:hypothetical protein [Ignavibacteriaceae bacterium]
MANLDSSFLNFCEKVRLTKSKKENLIVSREANRDRIKKHFKEILKEEGPDFFQQGSFSFKTTVNPIDCEYDVDDGVYLNNLDDDFIDKTLPKTAHSWIIDAVKDATNARVIDKPNCIRVVYAKDYHLDLPIYGKKDDKFYVANIKSNKWIENDPKGFNDWFYAKLSIHSEQMRRNIINLKAWADFNSFNNITGILIIVLVCENHLSILDRDDKSINETVKAISNYLKIYRSVIMPVQPFDNLLGKLSDNDINNIITSFENFSNIAQKAIDESDSEKAGDYWIKLLGDRFKIIKENINKNIQEKSISPIFLNNPSKPWGL